MGDGVLTWTARPGAGMHECERQRECVLTRSRVTTTRGCLEPRQALVLLGSSLG